MKRHFNTHLEGLNIQYWHDLIESHGKLLSLKKGEYLCRRGEPTNIFGYLKSGYLIYTVAGENGIGGFTFPQALFGDYPACMHNDPAMFDIMAGSKSEVWVCDATILPTLFDESVQANKEGRLFMESAYLSLSKRYYALYAKTASERYEELIEEYPHIAQDVPLKEIAEYLQIKPSSLSRIRKKLFGK